MSEWKAAEASSYTLPEALEREAELREMFRVQVPHEPPGYPYWYDLVVLLQIIESLRESEKAV